MIDLCVRIFSIIFHYLKAAKYFWKYYNDVTICFFIVVIDWFEITFLLSSPSTHFLFLSLTDAWKSKCRTKSTDNRVKTCLVYLVYKRFFHSLFLSLFEIKDDDRWYHLFLCLFVCIKDDVYRSKFFTRKANFNRIIFPLNIFK